MKRLWPTIVTVLWGAYTIGIIILVVFVQLTGQLTGKILLPVTTVLFFLFSLTHAIWHLGWRNALLLFGITFAVSLFFESFNLLTGGLFFGPLHYTHKLGIKLFELVPLLIPMTWFTVGYLSLLIAERILGRGGSASGQTIKMALLAAVILTTWDMGMDPTMAHKQYWVWQVEGHYFGIPLRNYLGWLTNAFCFFIAYLAASKRWHPVPWGPGPRHMHLLPPLAYALMWLSTAIVNLDLGLVGAAIVGGIAMGPFALYWLGSTYKEHSTPSGDPDA